MQIVICDICETRDNVKRVWLPYDRKMDAAGSMDTVGEYFDLCPTCHLNCLQVILKFLFSQEEPVLSEWTFNKKLIEVIKSKMGGG